MSQYSEEFKKNAVEKFFSRDSRTVRDICQELGVTDCSLYDWRNNYGKSTPTMSDNQRRPGLES